MEGYTSIPQVDSARKMEKAGAGARALLRRVRQTDTI